jgi:hypothetical protein
MPPGIASEPFHPPDRPFDLPPWHTALFHQAMRNHDRLAAVKEIQDAIMDTREGRPQFVDAIPQGIADRPPQFMSFRLQPGEIRLAFGIRFTRQPGEPLNDRNRPVLFQVVNQFCLRHATPLVFVNLRTFVKPDGILQTVRISPFAHRGTNQSVPKRAFCAAWRVPFWARVCPRIRCHALYSRP